MLFSGCQLWILVTSSVGTISHLCGPSSHLSLACCDSLQPRLSASSLDPYSLFFIRQPEWSF
jgi:hypothetical protein